ncbi:MAG: peptidase [Gemmatimonadetes bacterium]|nr:peptidase [Gemmatimonadota bacterium]
MSRIALAFALGACVAATTATAATAAAQTKSASTKPVWPDEGPRTWAPRPTVSAITANDLRTRLYQFADDSMMGRRIGELGNYKGTEYIAREFKRLGLKPAGDNGTYFQNLDYGPMGFDSTTSRLVAGSSALGARTDWVPIAPTATNGIGAQSDIGNAPTVFAGRWGDTTVALDPAAFRGKVAVFTATPAAAGLAAAGRGAAALLSCADVPDKFGAAAAAKVEAAARADSAAGRGGRGGGGRGGVGGTRDSRAQRAGAVSVLLIVPLDSVPRATVNGAFTSRSGMKLAAAQGALPGAAISRSAAATLFGKPVDQLTVGAAGQPVTEHWSYDWHMSATPGRNVIAILPGSDPSRAAEYVLVGAHNDHIGVNTAAVDHDSLRAVNTVTRKQGGNDPACKPTPEQQHQIDSLIARARSIRPPRRDSIMNGADDDGSGTVVLLEIAEKFVGEKPARSIIFVSHEGEESGLLGSKWFTDHPTVPLASIVAAHNMDMVGKGRVDQVKFGGPTQIQSLGSRRLSREFGDIIDSVNATRTETMAIDKTWDVFANPMNRFCRSDQVNYVHHDVPVTYFSTGYAQDYHQATDEPQYIEYEHAARVGRFIHDVMLAVANRKDKPAIAGADPAYPACR